MFATLVDETSEVSMAQTQKSTIFLLIPIACYTALVLLLGDWIIDDAGISFAYARNFSAGYGLVSQPGKPPVEAFSNFLWVLLLVPCFKLGIFDPVVTPKIMAGLLTVHSWYLLLRLSPATKPFTTILSLTLLALAPPLVIWSSSGLENSLSLWLAVVLLEQLVAMPRYWQVSCGALVALLGMTHPEQGIYALPAGMLCGIAPNLTNWRERLGSMLRFALTFVGLFGSLVLFRWSMFGRLFPFPFYAKGVHSSVGAALIASVSNYRAYFDKLIQAWEGSLGGLGPYLGLAMGLALMYLVLTQKLNRLIAASSALMLTGLVSYLLLDNDWMGEYRFATIFICYSIMLSFWLIAALTANADQPLPRWVGTGVLGLTLWSALSSYIPRFVAFASQPTVPFGAIARNKAFKFNVYQEVLDLPAASLMTYDTGAVLFYSKLKVFDLAGLSEPDVIAHLKKGTPVWLFDHPEFFDYVFEQIKPTFIETNAFFTRISTFQEDSRFTRDYFAIDAYLDYHYPQFRSGVFVRKDALREPAQLETLRTAYTPAPYSLPSVARILAWTELPEQQPRLESPEGFYLKKAMHYHFQAENSSLAELYYRKALAIHPAHFGANFQYASFLDAVGRSFEARPHWQRVYAGALTSNEAEVLRTTQLRLNL